jgi:hypothetical protein
MQMSRVMPDRPAQSLCMGSEPDGYYTPGWMCTRRRSPSRLPRAAAAARNWRSGWPKKEPPELLLRSPTVRSAGDRTTVGSPPAASSGPVSGGAHLRNGPLPPPRNKIPASEPLKANMRDGCACRRTVYFRTALRCLLSTCAVTRRRFPVGARPTRRFAPAGSNRSRHGGDEMSEAPG